MENRRIRKRNRRFWLGCLAVFGFVLTAAAFLAGGWLVGRAAAFRGTNIWSGGSEELFGKKRNYMYRWTDGYQMTFCLSPGKHMGSTVVADAVRTSVEDESIPYVGSRDDYEKLACICTWFEYEGNIGADNATYAAAQTAVWAIMNEGWESAGDLARVVDRHIPGTEKRFLDLKAYVEDESGGIENLPDWIRSTRTGARNRPVPMKLENGIWTAELDIGAVPFMAALDWQFEGESRGWTRRVSGGKLIFTYAGEGQEGILAWAALPVQYMTLSRNTETMNIYIPQEAQNRTQGMISAGPYIPKVYLQLSMSGQPSVPGDGRPEFKRYEHREKFLAHYLVDLDKSCAETGNPLKGAIFRVLEAFEEGQLGAALSSAAMTPKPAVWNHFKICGEASTDEDGHISHRDEKRYEYARTYCGGHPEPDYLPEPDYWSDPETGQDNSEEIEAVRKENERLKALWEACKEACSEQTDFHSEIPGEGQRQMLEEREEIYRQFIRLRYDYTFQEIQARCGYVRHGQHNDDKPIPVVRVSSSEAGGGWEIIDKPVITDESIGSGQSFFGGAEERSGNRERGGGVSLPPPEPDTLPLLAPSGDAGTVSYTFCVENHRTEGEIHINKRDSQLLEGESGAYDSYGDTQGDATLEGAVYGLYAAEDILHPDGRTGAVYRAGDLTAIGTTDKNGDASFLAYTEESTVLNLTGRPLIAGRYLVREIGRSEGYERAVLPWEEAPEDGGRLSEKEQSGEKLSDEKLPGAAWAAAGRADVTTAMTHPVDMHDGSWLEFDVTSQNTAEGFDILVSGFPEGSRFFRSRMKETKGTVAGGVVTGTRLAETGEYEKALPGEYRLDETGSYIPRRDSEGNLLYDTSKPVPGTYPLIRRLNYYPGRIASPANASKEWEDEESPDEEYVKQEANAMLEQMGYHMLDSDTGDEAPWTVIKLQGSTNRELILEILDWFDVHSFWDSGAVHSVVLEDGGFSAVLFHDQTRRPDTAVYEERSGILYVRLPVQTEEDERRHMFAAYRPSEYTIQGNYITVAETRRAEGPVAFPQPLEKALRPVYEILYEQYAEGENRLDGQGNPIPVYRKEYIYEEKEEITSDYELEPLPAEYDPEDQSYRIHADNRIDWSRTAGPVTETFRAEAPYEVFVKDGESMFYSDYLTQIKGVGASAFASAGRETVGVVELTYPGQILPGQDGAGTPGKGTRETPFMVEERIIRQPVKVIKDTQDHGLGKQNNFRFKVYLKSNLERLYRDREGTIVWLDRRGREIDVLSANRAYPGLVPRIFTKVPRSEEILSKDRGKAIEANAALYDENQEEAPLDYTAVLENHNYEKFFQAIEVANRDRWDDAAPGYSSYRPLGNEANRSPEAEENARASDMVRQFAIDWYLEEEAAKLAALQDGSSDGEAAAYGDQLYDKALYQALQKAGNYLKPFFAYDLDEIYAVSWDSEEGGGKDEDGTTLSADREAETCYYEISRSLPYGTYVAAEQQPRYAKLQDYPNRHYRIDRPREIVIPSVYETSEDGGETLSSRYIYRADMTPEEMTEQYQIRFCAEEDRIPAHNHSGDFEIYKYGAGIHRLRNGAGPAGPEDRFALTQSRWKPELNYYNDSDDRRTEPVTYYLAGGRKNYERVGQFYRYSSVSEEACTVEGRTGVRGMTAAWDGHYSPALVYRSMEGEPGTEAARVRFRNRLYKTRIRIEKMDSETGENLLHDEAIFNIYRTDCDSSPGGTGRAVFYEEDTVISGSREFLESMRAEDIHPVSRGGPAADRRYAGVVPAGTPVCREKDRVVQTDVYGVQTGMTASFTTARDGIMEGDSEGLPPEAGRQNTGYLYTPQPLSAGVYVLAEVKAPSGYVRCRPVAVEVYSDEVTYYRKGDRDSRVTAAVYKKKGQDEALSAARIYVENEPTRLQIEKRKEASVPGEGDRPAAITYRVGERIDGSLARIGGDPGMEYAYRNGRYMGYGWKKGTLEYLLGRKKAGEQVEIVYDGNLFAGYGYVTRELETDAGDGPYVAGGVMALFEGLLVTPSGDTQDEAYEGVVVERLANGGVSRMYVREGYAGSRTEFVQVLKNGENCWSGETVQRGDTDILYYDLGKLQLFRTESIDGEKVTYGFGRNHERMSIHQLERDKTHSIFAFRGSRPVLELEGNDFTEIVYLPKDRVLEGPFARPERRADGRVVMSRGVRLYHLDEEGVRDSLVDPYTGMAYALTEEKDSGTKVLVWPVKTYRDEEGRIIARDKKITCRIATAGESEGGSEYLTGTWKSEAGEESHKLFTMKGNRMGQNLHGHPVLAGTSGRFAKEIKPVYDEWGLPVYYRRSPERYEKETQLYDRSGAWIRKKEADSLEAYVSDSYKLDSHKMDSRKPVRHRMGESYILENVWVTGEVSPNDPFSDSMTGGQPDILRRVPVGEYIMEELKAPPGYQKGLPAGVIVEEDSRLQRVAMTDAATKIEVNKTDGSGWPVYSVRLAGQPDKRERSDRRGQQDKRSYPKKIGMVTEGKGAFSYTQLPGAVLALYEAKRIYTSDLKNHPSGTYLQKKNAEPLNRWTTGRTPLYLEGIPAGEYIMEEERKPEGFVPAKPLELEVKPAGQVQEYTLYNDHTKVEVEKYTVQEDGSEIPLNGAEFTLYPARITAEGRPEYDKTQKIDRFVSSDGKEYAGFIDSFEEMYRTYGTGGSFLSWAYKGKIYRARAVSKTAIDSTAAGGEASRFPTTAQLLFRTDEGVDIRVTVYGQKDNRQGRDFVYEYQFDYRKLPRVNERACSYLTLDGMRRFDYLPAGGTYMLVETRAAAGFGKAEPVLLQVGDTADIWRYRVLNEEHSLLISKTFAADKNGSEKELSGSELALYRAGDNGELIQDKAHLAAWWISGGDGVYTELDRIRGSIPEGYQVGDLKPHALRRLPEGDYWLVEQKSPDYYTTFPPRLIRYRLGDEVRIVRISDRPAEGRVEVRKTDTGGRPLTGAVFEITAYLPPDFVNPVLTKTFSDLNGTAELTGLPAGEIQADGSVIPYSYRLRELTPPDGYEVNPEIRSFEFEPNKQGQSYRWDESAVYRTRIADEKTRIVLRKQAFPKEAFVEGASLAVYPVSGMDEMGRYLYDRENPIAQWVSSGEEPDHVLEGLTAGRTYLLTELQTPAGYLLMEPVAFTLSEDGRRISSFSSRMTAVTVHHPGWFALKGRYAVKCLMEVTDENGRMAAEWVSSGQGRLLTEADGIRDNEIYTFTERTVYSDGSRQITGRVTRRVRLENGRYQAEDRMPEQVLLQLKDPGGAVAASWYPSENLPELTVGARDSEKEILLRNRPYVLEETTIYSDGGRKEERRFAFLLDGQGLLKAISAYDRTRTVRVSKTEITGEKEIPGAKMQILDEWGRMIEEWISGETPHEIEAELLPGRRYVLRELLPPEGYGTAGDITFTVEEDGSIQQVVMEDERLPEEHKPQVPGRPGRRPGPGSPKEPKEPKKPEAPGTPRRPGRAWASYQPQAAGKGDVPGSGRPRIPHTGDQTPGPGIFLGIMILAGAGMVLLKRSGKKSGWIFILVCLLALPALTVRAETVSETGDKEITVTYDPISGSPEEADIPPDHYIWQGREYQMVSCQLIAEENLRQPEVRKKTIQYSQVEQAAKVPETITVSDGGRERIFEAADISYDNWQWIPGFQFPVTVREYDAGSFYLGDRVAIVKEEQPMEGYEEELLELIGVNPDYYRIKNSSWSGEPWRDEEGILFRQAVVSGEKYVADVKVVYESREEETGPPDMAYQAVYRLTENEAEEGQNADGSLVKVRTDSNAGRQQKKRPPKQPGGLWNWIRNLSRRTKTVLGLGLLLLPILCLLLRRLLSGTGRNRPTE